MAATTTVYRRAVDAAWEVLTSPEGASSSSSGGSGSHDATSGSGTAQDTEQVAVAAAAAAAAAEEGRLRLSDGEWRELQQVFARGQDGGHGGLTPGFLEGSQHQRLVRGRSPRHRGNFLGAVQAVSERGWGGYKGLLICVVAVLSPVRSWSAGEQRS